MILKTCPITHEQFVIRDEDVELYDELSPVFSGKKYLIPPPSLSPFVRQLRRCLFTNDRHYARRFCNATGCEFISTFTPDSAFNVVCPEYWNSDVWNPMDYGSNYDFSKTGFFDQFDEIFRTIPLLGAPTLFRSENCRYSWVLNSKDCYFISIGNSVEHGYYGEWILESQNVLDSAYIYRSNHCIDCFDVQDSIHCTHLQIGRNCDDCHWSIDLQNCRHCLFCTNLKNSNYYVFNKEVSAEEFEKYRLELLDRGSHLKENELRFRFEELRKMAVLRDLDITQSENCTGDRIHNCKNCHMVFDVDGSENCHYSLANWNGKDSLDSSPVGAVLCLECNSGNWPYHCLFCIDLFENCKDLFYSHLCDSCEYCFWCIGLKHKKYCILNKQFTKEEYDTLVPQIIEHMMKAGEWGEFFPASMSPFGFNRSLACSYTDISREKAIERKYPWSDYQAPPPTTVKTIPAKLLPDHISETPDDVLNWWILCEVSGRPFRLISQELELRRKHQLPLPPRHPDVRQQERFLLRRGQTMYKRKCDFCGFAITTPIVPSRPEKVYCTECFFREYP